MFHPCRRPACSKIFIAALGALCLLTVTGSGAFTQAAETITHDPWDKAQVVTPLDLARLIMVPQGKKPLVIYVGFDFLYKSGHILGSQYVGTGKEAKGIEALKKWAAEVAHGQGVVIYCGCCPFKECPNIRPAFAALRQMGLTQLKVLYLEDGFAKNWLNMGYPSEKGQAK
ncbi:MAG TPA: rhodanese-like domain-containing protein [Terriglobia bacterium]|nr:rhodanese-like domain-containing protein [Terriglobia bacterium]